MCAQFHDDASEKRSHESYKTDHSEDREKENFLIFFSHQQS